MIEIDKQIIIAGPCAAESREQIVKSAHMAKERDILTLRTSLWKPRTKPGFDGVTTEGIEWLEEVARLGLRPATEVFNEDNARQVVDKISGNLGKDILIWIGSRNQNHFIQQNIGSVIKGEKLAKILIKNQPWKSQDHWMGIIDHVVNGGADPSQIILCHRGFTPGTQGLRNDPDFAMAMRVKRESGLPMLIDPSHIGGNVEKVLEIAKLSQDYKTDGMGFDGLMIEVHLNPSQALTDKDQQLTWNQFDQIRKEAVFQA